MKLSSFAAVSLLAITVSAQPPHNTDTDAMDQSQNDAIQEMDQFPDISDHDVQAFLDFFDQDSQQFTDAGWCVIRPHTFRFFLVPLVTKCLYNHTILCLELSLPHFPRNQTTSALSSKGSDSRIPSNPLCTIHQTDNMRLGSFAMVSFLAIQ
ncbi:hypothetical protein BASA61_001062 [Batrachochytrium salamandrivorans]|nr:hypothetical protein BASA61_001062 [Batrachochytrium salamandrivorans]